MINESAAGTDRLDYIVAHIKRSHIRLIPVIDRLMRKGVVSEVWLVSYFYSISAICQMPFVLSTEIYRLYRADMASEKAIEAHTQSVIALLLGRDKGHPRSWPAVPDWVERAAGYMKLKIARPGEYEFIPKTISEADAIDAVRPTSPT